MGPLDHKWGTLARKSANGLKFDPKFGDFPMQIPENAEPSGIPLASAPILETRDRGLQHMSTNKI